MKTNNTKKRIWLFVVLPVVVVILPLLGGLSYYNYLQKQYAKLAVDFTGIKDVNTETEGWGWIKSGSTLLRSAHGNFYTIYAILKNIKVIQGMPYFYDGWIAGTNMSGRVYTSSPSNPIRSSVDSTGIVYQNRIRYTNVFDKKTVLQIFFDEPVDLSSGNGYLLIVKPYYFEPLPGTIYSETGMFEARAFRSGANKVMYVSFSGSPWKKSGRTYPVSGRIKLVDDGTKFSVTGLVYTHVDGSKGYVTCVPRAGYSFYSFAYISHNKPPYFTTGLRGWNDSSVSDTICGVNLYNYGHFTFPGGLVCDAQSSRCPDGLPYSLSEDVYALFSGMDSTIAGEFKESAISGLVIPFVDKTTFQ